MEDKVFKDIIDNYSAFEFIYSRHYIDKVIGRKAITDITVSDIQKVIDSSSFCVYRTTNKKWLLLSKTPYNENKFGILEPLSFIEAVSEYGIQNIDKVFEKTFLAVGI